MAFTSFESFKSSQYVQFIGFLITSSPQRDDQLFPFQPLTFHESTLEKPNPW